MKRMLAIATLVISCAGCSVTGPSCLRQREEGAVATLTGAASAHEVAMHRVRYDTRGSQNDARVTWIGQSDFDGPRLNVYATRAGCDDFAPPPNVNVGDCTVLASAGWIPQGVASTAVLTHGRGNPERLGTPPEYKLWIVSDRAVSYTITITWFYGPDC